MATTLSRALRITQTLIGVNAFIDNDPTGMWLGYPYQWDINLKVEIDFNSGATDDFTYDASDIKVGDWVATSALGTAVKIIEILNVDGQTSIDVRVEDEDLYNIYNDPTFGGNGIGPDGVGLVFPINEINGLPVLGPVPSFYVDYNLQMDLFARFIQQNKLKLGSGGGGSDTLGTPTDGTFDDGAIRGWQTGVTTFTDAVDQLNQIMNKALPPKPTNVADVTIHFNNESTVVEGTLLANGLFSVNYGIGTDYPYLTPMAAISSLNPVSKLIEDIGNGDYGTLKLELNGTTVGSKTLTTGDDTGTYGSLEIMADAPYPPGITGIWSAMNVVFDLTVPDGISMAELSHTTTGSTKKFFIDETLLELPVLSGLSATVDAPVLVYSSGVPHLSMGSTVKFSMTGEKLVGRTFPAGDNMSLTTIPTLGTKSIPYTHSAFPSIIAVDNGPISVVDETFTFDADNVATQANFLFEARNSFYTATDSLDIAINYMSGDGSSGAYLAENGADLKRVTLDDGDRPVVGSLTFATDWNSGDANDLGDLKLWEAPIIGGSAINTQVDYSTGYIPAGPDFSDKPTTQYITFKLQGITNRITLSVLGRYSGMWIKLPGVTQAMPNATNGWWDATKQADFPQTLYPGHMFASDGCLLDTVGTGLAYTFGSISSASSDDNLILVRFALATGDAIEAIQIL